jgi:hypothetical protein
LIAQITRLFDQSNNLWFHSLMAQVELGHSQGIYQVFVVHLIMNYGLFKKMNRNAAFSTISGEKTRKTKGYHATIERNSKTCLSLFFSARWAFQSTEMSS